jgi:hypothetical protein
MRTANDRTIVIFGAGATKACGGPLTAEILPDVFVSRSNLARHDHIALLEKFLVENFHLPAAGDRKPDHFPPLPLVLSLLDTAIDRDDAFAANWPPPKLRGVREALEYAIFALLEYRLRRIQPHYTRFLEALYASRPPASVTVLSLNYDLIADNAIPAVAERRGQFGLPDYGCDIATDAYQQTARFGALLKLHGSLNWLYCPNCHRLDLGIAGSGRRTVKMLGAIYGRALDLDRRYGAGGSPCDDCGTALRPVLITPTHLKDYRNPHIARVWYQAARALREAKQAIFVGYSMPEDDVDVIYLFKRGLAHVSPQAITVVEYAPGDRGRVDEHPVARRYRALFGDDFDWRTDGFGAWIDDAARSGFASPAGRARSRSGTPRSRAPRTHVAARSARAKPKK